MGRGVGYDLVFGVIMGTGVGGALVIGGQVREGPQSIAGEWGHMILRPKSDRLCYCGQQGCVETYLSGPAIERHYESIKGEKVSLAEILLRCESGKKEALECVHTWLEAYGRAMANVINVVDPDIVILGGGVSNAACLYDKGREQVARYVFSDELLTPIVQHQLGDSAGVYGAALLTLGMEL
jgi:fructokinase